MRPSHPVRHFWAVRNQRSLWRFRRCGLCVPRNGTATRATPISGAAVSLAAEKKPASVATRRGITPSCWRCCSMAGLGVSRPLGIDLVGSDDLVFGFLDFDHLAELG